jgi:CDP-diacylglycerol--glycerol-3-phosphate 3-phosphatidyltransferase
MKYSLNIPNQITLARLALAIVFFAILSQYSHGSSHYWKLDVAAVVFIVAAGSDFIDGYLARKWKMVTPLGRVLDPMVDKVLICGAFILFLAPGFVDADGRNVTEMRGWMVVVIVGRELLVTGLRGFNESQGRAFGASLHGKVKMWIQSFAVPVILFLVAHERLLMSAPTATNIKLAIVWVTVLVTALSMLQYLARSRHILEESAAA